MTIPHRFTGFTEKIILWILASTLTIILAMVATMYAKVSNDAALAKDLAQQLNAEKPFTQQSLNRIEKKVDDLSDLMNEVLLKRFGYVPKTIQ